MRHAIVDSNNKVVSVVIWPNGSFKCPRNHQSIPSEVAKVGDSWDGQKFLKPDGSDR